MLRIQTGILSPEPKLHGDHCYYCYHDALVEITNI